MPHSETVQKFLDTLGPFYEYVDDENNNNEKVTEEPFNNQHSLFINEKLENIKQKNGINHNESDISGIF